MEFSGDSLGFALFASVGGLVWFFRGFWKLRTMRRIENTPTSVVRSMPMGLVELHGNARLEEPLLGPFSGKPVAFYEVRVEEYRRGSKGGGRWVKRHESSSSEPFYLEDETGRVLVLPQGAKTHLPDDFRERFSGSSLPANIESFMDGQGLRARFLGLGRRLRFTERHIEVGQHFYLHGVAQERPDLRERQRDVLNEKLRTLREDPEAMATLDVDGDGRVDPDEWEVARSRATVELRAEGIADRVVVGRGGPRDLFLISDRSEKDLVRRLRLETAAGVFGGGGAFVGGTAWLCYQLREFLPF